MLNTSQPWNNTVLCVDDEEGILEFYRQVLAPPMGDALELLRVRLARRRSWRADQDPMATLPVNRSTFRVLTAGSGEQALEIVRQERAQGRHIAAGFFDMKMPGGMDGLETIQSIKQIDPEILCAVVTAYTDRAVSQIAAAFQHQDEWIYFNKPFTEWELIQGATHLVSGWNLRRDRAQVIRQLQESNRRLEAVNDQLFESCLRTVRAAAGTPQAREMLLACLGGWSDSGALRLLLGMLDGPTLAQLRLAVPEWFDEETFRPASIHGSVRPPSEPAARPAPEATARPLE